MIKINFTQILQWLIILLLAISCFCIWNDSRKKQNALVEEVNFQKNKTQYVSISNEKSLSELKKVNQELYDSIRKIKDIKEAIQIKYITKYETDTIPLGEINIKDSLYHYIQNSDTISYDLVIKGKYVDWFKLGFSIQDSLMIVTRSKNGQSETIITHGENTTITDATIFIPKKTWIEKVKEKTYFGVGVGAGYGVINKKPDIYIGINAGIKF